MESLPETPCKNIKSRRCPNVQCSNPATHGDYCGIHYKHPRPWSPKKSPISYVEPDPEIVLQSTVKIQKWYRFWRGLYFTHKHGIAYFDRSLTNNDSDFFSTDCMTDISGFMFFSYMDEEKHVYGFDVRSIHTLIQNAKMRGEAPANPYTRKVIHLAPLRKVNDLVKWLHDCHVSTVWAPISPPTPIQQFNMKVVDLFTKIDELNYYSSPSWFIDLDLRGQKRFYTELHAIWTHRAGLSIQQKTLIVPNFHTRLFRHPPWALIDQTLESMQKLNMTLIRNLITSAEDKNDRILGAMYVVSTLTIVSTGAREAYPWLYESVAGGMIREEHPRIDDLFLQRHLSLQYGEGFRWLNQLLTLAEHEPLPILHLPPPTQHDDL